MPVTTALSRRLNVTVIAGFAYRIDHVKSATGTASVSLAGCGKGVAELTVCELLGLDNDLLPDLIKLVEVVANDISILDIKNSRLGPVAVGCESNLADHRVEGGLVNVTADRVCIQALRRLHSLFENLHARIGVRRHVKAKEIGTGLFCSGLVCVKKILDAGKIRSRRGYVEFVAQHIVQHRPKLLLQLGILQADH